MSKQKKFFQNTIAIIYDFDGTLSPQPMQEYTVLPKINIKPDKFWQEVDLKSSDTVSESMLVYMRLLLEKAEDADIHIGLNDLKKMGSDIKYFPGVDEWFSRVNDFVATEGKGRIKIKHYIVSAGLKEIIDGTSIRKHFSRVYASEYHFDHHDRATFPKILITDTTKTQYLFRINKGKESLGESINEHMPEGLRPIPFSNIIYIGDGITDVPSMAVTRSSGGNTIAVYKKNSKKGLAVCKKLLKAGRVHFIATADYLPGSNLDKRVKILLRSVITNIEYQNELFNCRRSNKMLG
ncbi:MAG: HAD family hydrolase [Gammaproteobacteria bacterium]|nr:HAD family hydrolase [Gammaproteobacteria bacterium]